MQSAGAYGKLHVDSPIGRLPSPQIQSWAHIEHKYISLVQRVNCYWDFADSRHAPTLDVHQPWLALKGRIIQVNVLYAVKQIALEIKRRTYIQSRLDTTLVVHNATRLLEIRQESFTLVPFNFSMLNGCVAEKSVELNRFVCGNSNFVLQILVSAADGPCVSVTHLRC